MKVIASFAMILLLAGFNWFSDDTDRFWYTADESSTYVVDHQPWQQILDEYLVEDATGVNLVDYEGIATDASESLDDYILQLAATDPRSLNGAEQMSYWINLYNALTVQLVAKNYPVDSIRDLGETFLSIGPWDDDLITVAGKTLTLNDIEHNILRPVFKDYRIHFAVNCASIGCPNLAIRVFTATNLETLLEEATRQYLTHPRGLELVDGELLLSSIFDWYQSDFGDSERAMIETISRYVEESVRQQLLQFDNDADYRYDWSLNDLG